MKITLSHNEVLALRTFLGLMEKQADALVFPVAAFGTTPTELREKLPVVGPITIDDAASDIEGPHYSDPCVCWDCVYIRCLKT